jgi:hypothetical protein
MRRLGVKRIVRLGAVQNRVKYYSFWAVFWQREFLPNLVLARRCDVGFLLYDQLEKTKLELDNVCFESVSTCFWYTLVGCAVAKIALEKRWFLRTIHASSIRNWTAFIRPLWTGCHENSSLKRWFLWIILISPLVDGLPLSSTLMHSLSEWAIRW